MNDASFEARLDALPSAPLRSVRQREATAFDEATVGRLGTKTLAGLRQLGVESLLFCDGNPELWGRDVDGILVVSPEDAAARYGKDASFAITIWGHKTAR